MSVDILQNKIRKLKNPIAVDFSMLKEHIPQMYFVEGESFLFAYSSYVKALLEALKTVVPAVRFNFAALAVYGSDGVSVLMDLLKLAKDMGYYVFLDIPEALSRQSAEHMAEVLFELQMSWQFDGLVLSSYIGSDGIAPYVKYLNKSDQDLFVITRTSNRSAPEIQDLLTGSRLAHAAMADIIYRYAQPLITRCGYSRIALVTAASSADSLRMLRAKYKDLFMLLDGSDYPNANAKNCSNAFDRLGHGAIACVGQSVTAAWQNETEEDPLTAALHAAERMKKNILRYINIL